MKRYLKSRQPSPYNDHVTYKTSVQIRFHEGDPAGITFFANAYALAHAAYETFVTSIGFSWAEWFENESWAVPIRHSECEHLAPMRPGRSYDVHITVEKLGESSVSLKYSFQDGAKSHAEVTLVHTFIDLKKLAKIRVPDLVRERLKPYLA